MIASWVHKLSATDFLLAFLLLYASVLFLRRLYSRTHPQLPHPAPGSVLSVSLSESHSFSKSPRASITLLAGLGIDGDCHAGEKVQHRSRLLTRGHEPNLRQVHLIHAELLEQLKDKGFGDLKPGDMGENILTRGLALLDFPTDTRLLIGRPRKADASANDASTVILRLTGLRNPCPQLDNFRPGLTGALREDDGQGGVRRLAGVMAVIERGGTVQPGDEIRVQLPARRPHKPLEPV